MNHPEILKKYNDIKWNDLLRKDLGKYSLEEIEPNLERIKIIFDDILEFVSSKKLSQQFINILYAELNNFLQLTDQIKSNFKDTSQKHQWIDRILNQEYEIYNKLSGVYSFIKTFDSTIQNNLRDQLSESEKKLKDINSLHSKTEELLENAQKQATQGEVFNYGNFFGQEAESNSKNAKINFIVMLFCVLFTGFMAVIFIQEVSFIELEGESFFSNLLNTINTQNIIIKLVVISLGAYLISHFSKTYSAEKHLYNINIQKQNALNSHKQMLDSVISTESDNDKEIRNAILLELTRAMFESKDSGYLKNIEVSTPTNQIIEISKTLTK